MRHLFVLFVSIALTTTFASACKDPSRDVPSATVSETTTPTTPTTETEPAAEEPPAEPTLVQSLTLTGENTRVTFVGSKVTGSHDGGFNQVSGSFELREPLEASTARVVINMDSLFTDAEGLTGHLKNEDFFDVPNHPESVFVISSLVAGAEGGTHTVTGELTLRGVTKAISYPATIQVNESNVTVTAEFSINRSDFNITYTGMADDMIRDGVVIRLNLDLPRQ